MQEMQARPDGFELVFTQPVDAAKAGRIESYTLKSYTHLYSGAYGSEEIQVAPHRIASATVSGDRLRVRLRVEGLREHYVHELRAEGVRSAEGEKLDFSDAYYTLNRVPKQ